MKTTCAACAALAGALFLAGSPALAYERCPPAQAAAGLCAPVHFVDDDDLQRAYRRGYLEGRRGYRRGGESVPPPPEVAVDGKEGYSQGAEVHRQHLDRDQYQRRRAERDFFDRYFDRDDYDRRYRGRDDAGEVVDFATDILRGLSN